MPLQDPSLDPIDRGWADVYGSVIFDGADREASEDLLRFMYQGPDRQADKNLVYQPMWGLPPYRGIVDTDVYRTAGIFQAHDGQFLDLQRQILEDIAPHLSGNRPRSPAALYARQGDTIIDMVYGVLVEGEPVDAQITQARDRLRARLEEGQERDAITR